MKCKKKWYICYNIDDLYYVINHNVDATTNKFKKLNNKIGYLVLAVILLGISKKLCYTEQNRKIKKLEKKLNELNTKIKELENKKGD